MRGNVEQRGEGIWRVRVYLGRHPETRIKRYARRTIRGTRDDAHQACAKLLLEVGAGYHRDDSYSVAELLHRWLALVEADLSPSTVRDYRSVIERHIIPTLGGRQVEQVRTAELDQWYRALELGAGRVRRIHNVLASAFDQAVRWQWIASNPCRSARPPRVVEREIAPPGPAEVRRLFDLAAETEPDLAAYIHLSAATGARRGELVALRWSDVDLDTATLIIRRAIVDAGGHLVEKDTKTHAARAVALDATTVAVLRALRLRQTERALAVGARPADSRLFTLDPEGLVGWRPDYATHRFRRLLKRADLEGIRLHDLRHFVATQMLAAGVDPRTVAGRLGHRRVATLLDRYAHFVPAADRAAADQLGRLLSGE